MNTSAHVSLLDHLGFEKLKKCLKWCLHTFYLIWLGLKLWCYLRFLWDIFLWLCCIIPLLDLKSTWTPLWVLFEVFKAQMVQLRDMCWGIHVGLAPKEVFSFISSSNLLWSTFEAISGSNTVLEKDNVWFLIKFSSVWQQRQWLSLTQSQLIGFVWFLLLIKGNKRRCLWLKVNFYPTHPLKFLLFTDFWSQNSTHVCN